MFIRFICLLGLFGLALGHVHAQTTLSGQVTDAQGNPLAGAHVFLQGSTKGDYTLQDGSYTIDVEAKAGTTQTVIASYLGYQRVSKDVTITSGQANPLNFELQLASLATEEIVVSSTRALSSTPISFATLDKTEINERNLGQDMPFLLRFTPSVVVTSDAGTGIGYTGIRVRGTDPTRTNVTINGIPLNDAESQGVFWVNMPDFASSTESIQIQRGVGASTNGTAAFGATINLNTEAYRPEPFAELNAAIGSFNTTKVGAQFGTGTIGSGWNVSGRLSKIDSDGYIDRASADLRSLFLNSTYQANRSRFSINVFSGREVTYQAWNGVPANLVDDPKTRTSNSAGTDRPGEPHDNEVDDYGQDHIQFLFNHELKSGYMLDLAAHYTHGAGFFELYKGDETITDYGVAAPVINGETVNTSDLIQRRWLDNDFYGITYGLRSMKAGRITPSIGGNYSIYEGDHFGEVIWAEYAQTLPERFRYYENDARKTDFNIYGKADIEISEGFIGYVDLQYRSVDYEFLGVDQNGNPLEQSEQLGFFNPKVGLTYNLEVGRALYASFAIGQREPNRDDFTESPTGQRPKPEKLANWELGYRSQSDKLAWSTNLYYMDYTDQLAVNGQLNDVGASVRTNIDDSYRAGLELTANYKPNNRWQLGGTATYSQNKVKRFEEFVDVYDENFNWLEKELIVYEDTDLAFSPDLIVAGQVFYQFLPTAKNHDLELGVISKYVSEQYLDNTSDENNVLKAYTFSDLQARYTWQRPSGATIGFNVLVRNVFDELFESNGWSYRYRFAGDLTVDQGLYPQAGRNILVGLQLRF